MPGVVNNNTRTFALGHMFRWERSVAHSGRELREKQGTSRAYSDEATGTLTASLFGAALGARLLRGVSRLNCLILYKSAL